MSRSCGSCTACCSSLVIEELNKPAFTTCGHDCSAGAGGCGTDSGAKGTSGGASGGGACGIYEDRPDSCRSFRCLWLDGHLGENDRPDKLGVIFTTTYHEKVGTHPLLVEAVPGKSADNAIRDAVDQFTQKSPVLVLTAAGGTFHPSKQPATTALTIEGHAA